MNTKVLSSKFSEFYSSAGVIPEHPGALAERAEAHKRLPPGPALLLMAALSTVLWFEIAHILHHWL